MVRKRLTAEEETDAWARWRQGEGQRAIAQALRVTHPTIGRLLRRTGGIAPRLRRRARRVLQTAEREEISRGLATGETLRAIARQLGRAPLTVSREVGRHGGRGWYRAGPADAAAWGRARRPKPCRLATHAPLRRAVARKLARNWAPEQIAAWLKRTYADRPAMQVSHETIYRTLFVQSRGVFKRELLRHLRRRQSMRRARRPADVPSGPLADAISIRARPAEAVDRAVPGHWEGDLLTGTIDSQIATLVERHSRYVMLVRMPTKAAPAVAQALARHVRSLPQTLRLHHRHRRPGVFLRPAQPVAARVQRKHQRALAAVLPPRDRPLPVLASGAQSRRPRAERAAPQDAWLANPR